MKLIDRFSLIVALAAVISLTYAMLSLHLGSGICFVENIEWIRITEVVMGCISIPYLIKMVVSK